MPLAVNAAFTQSTWISQPLQYFCFPSPSAQIISAVILPVPHLKCGVTQCLQLFYLAVSGFLSQALRDGNFTLWLNNNAKASFFDYYYLFFFYIALIPWVWCSMDSRGGTEISVIYCLCTQSLWNEEESSHNMLSGNVSAGRYVTSDLIRNRSQNGLRGQCFSLPENTAGFGCWKGPFAQNRLFCVAGGKENHL